MTELIKQEGMLSMEYVNDRNGLFGDRFIIIVTKKCKNIPGFAPDYYNVEVGQVIVKYKGLKPYFQSFGDSFPNLEKSEFETIVKLFDVEPKDEDFPMKEDKE